LIRTLLRMLLIGVFLYGITSERKLLEELRMHLAWRWFIGLGFDQEIREQRNRGPTEQLRTRPAYPAGPHSQKFYIGSDSAGLVRCWAGIAVEHLPKIVVPEGRSTDRWIRQRQ